MNEKVRVLKDQQLTIQGALSGAGTSVEQQAVTPVIVSDPGKFVAAIVGSRRVIHLSVGERKRLLFDCITAAIFIGGWSKKEDVDMQLMVMALLPDLQTEFNGFHEGEIKLAFDRGAKGYYGDSPAGMAVVTCLDWLRAFRDEQGRGEAKKLIAKKQQKDAEPYRPPMWRSARQQAIQDAYDDFLKKDTYHDIGNFIYRLADNERITPFTLEEKRAFIDEARINVWKSIAFARNSAEKNAIQARIDEITEGNEMSLLPDARRLALLALFGRWKSAGVQQVVFCLDCPAIPFIWT